MKQKTAIRLLIEFVDEQFISEPFTKEDHIRNAVVQLIIEKAHSLESVNEQQMKNAFNQGYREGELSGSNELNGSLADVSQFEDAEIYFTQTFEKP